MNVDPVSQVIAAFGVVGLSVITLFLLWLAFGRDKDDE